MQSRLSANFWKLLTAKACSNLGDGVVLVAMPLLAVQLTDSPALVAGVTVATRLPWLLFSLHAGALADRLDRRRTVVGAHLVRMVILIVFTLTIFLDMASLLLLYIVTLVLGIAEVLAAMSEGTLLPMVVPREQRTRANGLSVGAEVTLNEFVGPPLGGALAGLAIAFAFLGSALTYVIAAAAIALMIGSFRPLREGRTAGMLAEIGKGAQYVWNHRLLRTLNLMVAVMAGGYAAWLAVYVLYALGPMGLSEFEYGLLLTAGSIGGIASSQLTEPLQRRFGQARLLMVNVVGTAIMFLTPALTSNVWVVGAAGVIGGWTGVMWNVVNASVGQNVVPERFYGRVGGVSRLLAWGTMPVGAALGGLLGEVFGLRVVFATAGLMTASLLLWAPRVVTDETISAAEDANDAAEVQSENAVPVSM